MFLKLTNSRLHPDRLRADIVVIGSGPGGAIASALLAETGRDVLLLEEGPYLPLESALHFSREEIAQKYRNGGLTVSMGKDKVAYVEGRCVGGGSEINRGLYHRTPSEVLETWQHQCGVTALSEAELRPHFEACEQRVRVSYLAEPAPPLSLKLHEGALKMGWACVEVPRLVCYEQASKASGARSTKQSMTQTFIPQYLEAGGRLLPDTWVRSLSRHGGRWQVQAASVSNGRRWVTIEAETVFVACGAVQTPALLRRSGLTRHVGDTLRFHPMIKVIAQFPQEVNSPGMLDPVHQIKEFDPRFSMGCSISSLPVLALTMMAHPEHLPEVQRNWRCMGIYYAQTTGGRGSIRTLPGCRDPLIQMRFSPADLQELGEALRRLCECLFAAGAVAVYPAIADCPVLTSDAELALLPATIPASRANLSTLHLFSSCRMGEKRHGCAADSFGKVYAADQLYIADASLLCGPTTVNPQGTVMAIAHRNLVEFLGS
jgi:choline dehydrogenase-like flavoprotein